MLLLILILLIAAPARAQHVLTARVGNGDVVLTGDAERPELTRALRWQPAQPGLEWTELQLEAGRVHVPVRAVIARIDPDSFDLGLELMTQSNGMSGAWNVDSVPRDVALALNAGQFKETGPWGWLVIDGYERRDPGFGPLSAGFAIDSAGAIHWFEPAALVNARRHAGIRYAFQSYPLLRLRGSAPPLLARSRDIDRAHRDARLILAETRDGRLLVVLTRYDAMGGFAQRVPIGLTVPESLLLVSALGAQHALMLDGGISAQLLVRDARGAAHVWKGLRNVPLALYARPRRR